MAKKTAYDFYGVIEDNVVLGHRTPVGGSHNIAVPEGAVEIWQRAFEGEGCESVILPSTLKIVKTEAFNHCTSLREVVIPEGIEELGPWAFNACYSLESVHLPASLTKIDKKNQPFNNCMGLKQITVDENNPVLRAEGNCLIERATGIVVAGCQNSVIPDDGSITAIGEGAFCRQIDLKKINIPAGVKSIGTYAFLNCRSLKEIVLPESVKKLDVSAFEGCENLEKINLERVERIERNAFEHCEKLKGDIVISDSCTKIGSAAFAYTLISSIVIGKGITAIESNTFRSCHKLTKVVLPETLTKIDKYAFIGCANLKDISIPSSVKYIGGMAFAECTLKDVVLPPEPDFISKDAFTGCTLATKIARKTSNPDYEMDGTAVLKYRGKATEAVIPDGVTAVKAKAFKGKKNLKSVVIPATVTAIAASAFEGCANLCSITVDGANKKYRDEGNCIIDVKKKTLVCGCNASVLPEKGIEKIGNGAFYKCKELKSAVIPHGVKSIGKKAFEECASLKTVSFPDGLELVEENAFSECSQLEAAVFGAGLQQIGLYAFYYCENLTKLILPEGLKEIRYNAFEGCAKLEVIDLPEGVKSIDSQAFARCHAVKSISLPSTLTDAYNAGFSHMPKLERITVAEGNPRHSSEGNCLIDLKHKELMAGCPTSVIPAGKVRYIRARAFADSDLVSIDIPEGVEVIDTTAFSGCTKLRHLSLPNSIINMWSAFEDARFIETVTAPEKYRKTFEKINPDVKFTATAKK